MGVEYRHIKQNVKPIIDDLAEGNTPGDQITGTNYVIFKVRANIVMPSEEKVAAIV